MLGSTCQAIKGGLLLGCKSQLQVVLTRQLVPGKACKYRTMGYDWMPSPKPFVINFPFAENSNCVSVKQNFGRHSRRIEL
jgi:hypothetical protein